MGTAVSEGGAAHGVRVAGHQGERQAWPGQHHRDRQDGDGGGGGGQHGELVRADWTRRLSLSLSLLNWFLASLHGTVPALTDLPAKFYFLPIFV